MGEAAMTFKTSLAISGAAFFVGFGLLVAWAYNLFGDWTTFVVGALLVSGGAFGMLDVFEEHEADR